MVPVIGTASIEGTTPTNATAAITTGIAMILPNIMNQFEHMQCQDFGQTQINKVKSLIFSVLYALLKFWTLEAAFEVCKANRYENHELRGENRLI